MLENLSTTHVDVSGLALQEITRQANTGLRAAPTSRGAICPICQSGESACHAVQPSCRRFDWHILCGNGTKEARNLTTQEARTFELMAHWSFQRRRNLKQHDNKTRSSHNVFVIARVCVVEQRLQFPPSVNTSFRRSKPAAAGSELF